MAKILNEIPKIIHTSESLKEQDGEFENWHYQLDDNEEYMLSKGEFGWLQHVTNCYSIASHIWENSYCDDDDNLIYKVELFGMSEALQADGMAPKAVMLDDETALQAIFFYSSYLD